MLAIIEFLGLVLYEVLTACAMSAFRPMEQKKKALYLFWALLPLALMTMFHSENIGNDTRAYTGLFELVRRMTLKQALSIQRYEKGYVLFTYALTRMFSSSQSILIGVGAIMYFSLARWLKKWSAAPGLFVCLIVEMLIIDGWMSVLRQTLATAVLLFAFDAVLEKKPLRFVLLVILAAQFHAAAYAFLFAYPVVWWFKEYRIGKNGMLNRSWKFEWLVVGCAVSLALFLQPVLNMLLRFFPKYQYYVSGAYMNGQARLAIVLKIVVYGLMLAMPRLIVGRKSKQKSDTKSTALYRMSLLNLVLLIASSQATILTRIAGVFSIYAIEEYSAQLARLKHARNRMVMVWLSLILFAIYGVVITLLRTPEWQTTYPFEWFFQ